MSPVLRLFVLAAVMVTPAACGGPPTLPPAPDRGHLGYVPTTWPLLREVEAVEAPRAMVSSVHPLASQVGVETLRRGGNAVDAAVAVGFALAVVHPSAGNLGGGGFMVARFADGTAHTLDYRETAPSGATRNMYVDSTGAVTDASVLGHLAAGVPGSVAGLAAAHRRFGRLAWRDVVEPAVRLATDGFVIDEDRSASLRRAEGSLRQFPASARQYLTPAGHAPEIGTVFRQPDLARTLRAIADSGARVFYEGHIADLIVAEMRLAGGLMSLEDLRAYRPLWRDPITVNYRGYTIYSMPPASSGGVTMGEILNIVEGFEPPPFGSAAQVHVMAEAMRRAFTDRNHYLGDPAFVDMPIDQLLSKPYAADRRRTIHPRRATPSDDVEPGVGDGDHTTHYSVVDTAGNAVSVTTTINSSYGSKVTVAGGGFLLNNEMDDFTSAPGEPNQYGLIQGEANAIAPGKRMLSAMTPSIVLDPDRRLFLVVGTPGGPTIITTVTQVITNIIDHAMSLAEAVAAPRVHHQALPDDIRYERGGLLPEVVRQLERMGHVLNERSGHSGEVAAIMRSARGWIGVADPRAGGGAVGY